MPLTPRDPPGMWQPGLHEDELMEAGSEVRLCRDLDRLPRTQHSHGKRFPWQPGAVALAPPTLQAPVHMPISTVDSRPAGAAAGATDSMEVLSERKA